MINLFIPSLNQRTLKLNNKPPISPPTPSLSRHGGGEERVKEKLFWRKFNNGGHRVFIYWFFSLGSLW
jgi:hypothetical protein